MDLHFTSAVETPEERAAVDAQLGPANDAWNGGREARERRHLLLPVLHAIAERVGWISEGALNYASRRLAVPPAEAYGVATFYAMFSTTPRPRKVLHVCDDIACAQARAEEIARSLDDVFCGEGEPSDDGGATWLRSPCLGLCDRAPAALLTVAGDAAQALQFDALDAEAAVAIARSDEHARSHETQRPHVGGSPLRLLARVGRTDPESIDDYLAVGGYRALRRAFELGPQRVVDEVVASNLLGRGGAAFPAGRKLHAVAAAPAHPHYLVCNADESEPGTFKDRVLLENDPFAIVEAMTIAGYAAGCARGFVYLRGEYPLAARRLSRALASARERGYLGDDILGSGFAFEVEIRRGAGAYICGEETALFNSIEGKRGEPRSKPPFPAEIGLFGKPTLVNNVETLANLPGIVLEGGAAYAQLGTPGSTGTRLFCLSGAVRHPGLYEVEHGTPLRRVLELAAAPPENEIAALLLGGAAGGFVGKAAFDMPLSFEGARAAGATLGSGVVMVFDRSADLAAIVLRIARFFREESCGQCVPCRIGTVRQEEALQRLVCADPARRGADVALLDEIGRAMRDASICGLGQTAASAVASALTVLDTFSTNEPA